MTAPIVAFFNNRGGVGKTSLVCHISWMASELGVRVLAADLDPQANLTAAFFPEPDLEQIWPVDGSGRTVYGAVRPLVGASGMEYVEPYRVGDRLHLLAGDIELAQFEDELSQGWLQCLAGRERAFHMMSALWRLLTHTAEDIRADVVFVDIGPNLGALNRAALIASDYVVIPLMPDLVVVQGLRNLGMTLRDWRLGWAERVKKNPSPETLTLPNGDMRPIGYVLSQHGIRAGQPTLAYRRWMDRVPSVYRTSVLDVADKPPVTAENDKECLAQIKNYRSLMSMAQEAHKPIFALTAADGAFGGHQTAARGAFADFRALTRRILDRAGVPN